jgi:hypothetical protein
LRNGANVFSGFARQGAAESILEISTLDERLKIDEARVAMVDIAAIGDPLHKITVVLLQYTVCLGS